MLAYPDGRERWLDESTPLDTSLARAAIGAPVITMESLVRSVPPDRLGWCILCGGTFVGPGTAQDDLIAQVKAGRAVVPGDGTAFFSPVHVADLASAMAAALRTAPLGSVFNVVDEPSSPLPLRERLHPEAPRVPTACRSRIPEAGGTRKRVKKAAGR